MSRRYFLPSLLTAGLVVAITRPTSAAPDFPVPNAYPLSWELKFSHGIPKRIAVDVPGQPPKGYWYMTYTVTNEGDKEQNFYPKFDILTDDGKVHQSDQKIPRQVFDKIKSDIGNKLLEPYTSNNGPIRLGPAEAHDGVAIWPETVKRMEHFTVFCTGLCGEAVIEKEVDGKLTKVDQPADIYNADPEKEKELLDHGLKIFRKTLQMNFFIRGDEVYPGEDEVNQDAEEWVMR
jgi:hypothetical protein